MPKLPGLFGDPSNLLPAELNERLAAWPLVE